MICGPGPAGTSARTSAGVLGPAAAGTGRAAGGRAAAGGAGGAGREDAGAARAGTGDVALLGLPHKVSAKVAPDLLAAGVKIVDMSGDFRLKSAADYRRYYGAEHPHPELLGTFVYGLPELNREAIRQARAVASP